MTISDLFVACLFAQQIDYKKTGNNDKFSVNEERKIRGENQFGKQTKIEKEIK